MRRLLLIILPLLCSAVHANAQYLDNSMRWVMKTDIWFLGTETYRNYVVSIENDTVIDGMEYYILERNGLQTYHGISNMGVPQPVVASVISERVGFLREEGTRFFRKP